MKVNVILKTEQLSLKG